MGKLGAVCVLFKILVADNAWAVRESSRVTAFIHSFFQVSIEAKLNTTSRHHGLSLFYTLPPTTGEINLSETGPSELTMCA